MSRAWWCLLCSLACLCGVPSAARAADSAPACDAAIQAWARRCAAREALAAVNVTCPAGRLVLTTEPGLGVEIVADAARAFRAAGQLGLSPVGSFPDWNAEPLARRAAFEGVARCVTHEPPPIVLPDEPPPPVHRGPGRDESTERWWWPWRLALALVALLALAIGRMLHAPWLAARRAALAVTAVVLTHAVRSALVPTAELHQNGQGSLWIRYALRDHAGLADYGAGYAELLSLPARLFAGDPERGVFAAQSWLGASAVLAVFWLARCAGARLALALGLACVFALDPFVARAAASESYFGTLLSLAAWAAALLAAAGQRGHLRSLRFVLLVLAAGLVVAQAARVHPCGWIPLATLPAVVAAGPGRWRSRVQAALAAGVGVGLVVMVFSGAELWRVLHGALIAAWAPNAGPSLPPLDRVPHAYWAVLAVLLALPAGGARRRALIVASVATVALAAMMRKVGGVVAPVARAELTLYAPTLFALAAAALARVTRRELGRARRYLPLALAAAGALYCARQRATASLLPTDVREVQALREWRARLPARSTVVHLRSVGSRLLALPVYGASTQGIDAAAVLPEQAWLLHVDGPLYYYRSSLCASPEGAELCSQLEARLELQRVEERTLPALPSAPWIAYPEPQVQVWLARVTRAPE